MNVAKLNDNDIVLIDISKLGDEFIEGALNQYFDDEVRKEIIENFPLGIVKISNIQWDRQLHTYCCDINHLDEDKHKFHIIGLPIKCIVSKLEP